MRMLSASERRGHAERASRDPVMQQHESDRCHRHRRIVRGIRHKAVTLRREERSAATNQRQDRSARSA